MHVGVQELVGVGVLPQPLAQTQPGALPCDGGPHSGHRQAAACVFGARLEHGELEAAGLASATTAAVAEPQSAGLRLRHVCRCVAHLHLPHVGSPRSQLCLWHERLLSERDSVAAT